MKGESIKNERSLSSASATKKSPSPSRAWAPTVFNRPPTTIVGSKPAFPRTAAIIDVVDVLP